MRDSKRKRLEAKGWQTGSADEFLDLSSEESAYIELKLNLSDKFKKERKRKKLTQTEAALLLGSSQSRIAKMEAGDPSVSIDLLVRSLLALGTTSRELGKTIGSAENSLASSCLSGCFSTLPDVAVSGRYAAR